jgi:N-acetyl-beta-hexosaminidase
MIVYSHEEVKEIIDFAGGFGIRVIPEVNMPGIRVISG